MLCPWSIYTCMHNEGESMINVHTTLLIDLTIKVEHTAGYFHVCYSHSDSLAQYK